MLETFILADPLRDGKRSLYAATAVALIVLSSVLASFIAYGPTALASSSMVTCGAGTPQATVSIVDFSFNPSTITVVIGVNNTVEWTNNGASDHTVTSDSSLFGSGTLAPGSTFICTFNAAGSYSYHCSFHTFMTGTVDVVSPGGTTTTTTTTSATATTTTASVPQPKVPTGIVAWVPVTLTNSQPVATPGVYDQKLVVNSSRFAVYEASGLQNVEFFAKSGSVIPSWLESGNSNSSTATVYWLRMPSRVPAGGTLTVYMGFASMSTVLLNGKKVGEAPQLSPTYGAFDSGKRVFFFYDNFLAGESSGAWAKNLTGGGTFILGDSLTVNFGGSPGYFVTGKVFRAKTGFDALVMSFSAKDDLGFVNRNEPIHVTASGQPQWAGAFVRSDCLGVYPDQWNNTGEANACGVPDGNFVIGSSGASGIFSVGMLTKQSSVQSINYSGGVTLQPIGVDNPKVPASAGFMGEGGSVKVQWARERVLPPNGVMPSAAFGTVHVLITISKGASVSTNALFYVPQKIEVTPGAIVTWVNRDSVGHTVTSDSLAFNSGAIAPKGVFTFTFTTPGTYSYHCSFHAWMTGTITVVPA